MENPKSEYRNPKQIRNSKVQKRQTKKRHLNLESRLGGISNFGFRASNLQSALAIGSLDPISRATFFSDNQKGGRVWFFKLTKARWTYYTESILSPGHPRKLFVSLKKFSHLESKGFKDCDGGSVESKGPKFLSTQKEERIMARDLSFIGRPREYDSRRVFSLTGADWQDGINFDRLRKDQLAKRRC